MPLLNFQKQFASGVRASVDEAYKLRSKEKPKRTTIRAMRKRPFKKGDKLYLYTGLKTKNCHKLGEAICTKAELCKMDYKDSELTISMDDRKLTWEEIIRLANIDGFSAVYDFIKWFQDNYGFPFIGQRITWKSTYNRKYYLNQKVRALGFRLKLEETAKTILVPQNMTDLAASSKYITELQQKHNYGVQLTLNQ